MNIAVIKNTEVVNVAVFADIETAQSFLAQGAFGDADTVTELPDGYGIGDTYDGEWHKAELPESPELTPAEKRRQAYEIRPVVQWGEDLLTIDQAKEQYLNYASEGDERANEIKLLIHAEKQKIREEFPDE